MNTLHRQYSVVHRHRDCCSVGSSSTLHPPTHTHTSHQSAVLNKYCTQQTSTKRCASTKLWPLTYQLPLRLTQLTRDYASSVQCCHYSNINRAMVEISQNHTAMSGPGIQCTPMPYSLVLWLVFSPGQTYAHTHRDMYRLTCCEVAQPCKAQVSIDINSGNHNNTDTERAVNETTSPVNIQCPTHGIRINPLRTEPRGLGQNPERFGEKLSYFTLEQFVIFFS